MALVDVIASFATGTYSVTRTAAGAYTVGRYAAGGTSTFSIEASVQPVTGRDLKKVPEGHHADELRIVYTTTELRTRAPGSEPDVVTIDSEPWHVVRFERWQAFGGTHFRAWCARRVTP